MVEHVDPHLAISKNLRCKCLFDCLPWGNSIEVNPGMLQVVFQSLPRQFKAELETLCCALFFQLIQSMGSVRHGFALLALQHSVGSVLAGAPHVPMVVAVPQHTRPFPRYDTVGAAPVAAHAWGGAPQSMCERTRHLAPALKGGPLRRTTFQPALKGGRGGRNALLTPGLPSSSRGGACMSAHSYPVMLWHETARDATVGEMAILARLMTRSLLSLPLYQIRQLAAEELQARLRAAAPAEQTLAYGLGS